MDRSKKPPIWINLLDAEEKFSPIIWERGEAYAEAGRVLSLSVHGSDLLAQVKGSLKWSYDVRLCVENGQILTGTCSCPYDNWCKHMVAVAITCSDPGSRGGLRTKIDHTQEISDDELQANLAALSREVLVEWMVGYARDDIDLREALVDLSLHNEDGTVDEESSGEPQEGDSLIQDRPESGSSLKLVSQDSRDGVER